MERYYPGRLAKGQNRSVCCSSRRTRRSRRAWMRNSRRKSVRRCGRESDFRLWERAERLELIPSLVRAPLVTLTDCYVDRIRDNATAMRERGYAELWIFKLRPRGQKVRGDGAVRGVESIRACAPYQRGLFTIGAVNKNETSAYEWEHLIPKVFWRGNDFEFLWSRVYREGTGKSDEACRRGERADAQARRRVMMECMTNDRCGPRV